MSDEQPLMSRSEIKRRAVTDPLKLADRYAKLQDELAREREKSAALMEALKLIAQTCNGGNVHPDGQWAGDVARAAIEKWGGK
jgi:hypothetical protein